MKIVNFTVKNTLAGAGTETVRIDLPVSPEEEVLLRAEKPDADALAPLFARVCRESEEEFDYLGGCEERPETPRRLAVVSWTLPAEP